MQQIEKKQRLLPCKPEWKIILENIVSLEPTKLYRICRKMIISLQRMKVPEIQLLLEELNPTSISEEMEMDIGPNWPKPKGRPFKPGDIIFKLFDIADNYLSDEQLADLLKQWIIQENLDFISSLLERRHAPLNEIIDSVKKFLDMTKSSPVLSFYERVGLSVSLIQRLLADNLDFINIAKRYLNIEFFGNLIDKIVGPANGNGRLGGKSAGLILAYQILLQNKKSNSILENVKTPKSWFITSDTITDFIHFNALEEFVYTKYMNPEEIKLEYQFLEYIFKNAPFPAEMINHFVKILEDLNGKPIIIRSSSLLEDSFEAAFSGKYKSLFISNIGTKEERLTSLLNAVAEVYSSTFGPDPIVYRRERGLIDFREEMGVLIQEVVGTKVGKYYLPSYAGVAFSNNEFSWSPRISRQDGVIRLVTGLGTRAVDRTMNDYPTLISPGKPNIKVNASFQDRIKYSQQFVDVINLETNKFETIEFSSLINECKGNFPAIEHIVSFNRHGTLVDPISAYSDFTKEDLIVTFNGLTERTNFVTQIKEILKYLQSSFNKPVDIEFASDGKTLYLLQCRPQSRYMKEETVHIPSDIPSDSIIFTANQFVSNGLVKNLEYIVYVDPIAYSNLKTIEDMNEVGRIISLLNRILPQRKFILIGPGRWGSKGDIKLGVPVIYSDINNTGMLIEVAKQNEGYEPELSFGTHFFQDLVEANIKYLPLYPDKKGVIFNDSFFRNSENKLCDYVRGVGRFTDVLKVINLSTKDKKATLSVYMDGESSKAVAFTDEIN